MILGNLCRREGTCLSDWEHFDVNQKNVLIILFSFYLIMKFRREVNKGHAIETLHHRNDGLWTLKEFKK